jgi:hypothetical protein
VGGTLVDAHMVNDTSTEGQYNLLGLYTNLCVWSAFMDEVANCTRNHECGSVYNMAADYPLYFETQR